MKKANEPYLWKQYKVMDREFYEFRYFHGITREWGEVKILPNGMITWRYAFYHPFRNIKSLSGDGVPLSHKELPFWFIKKIHDCERMIINKKAM